MTPVRTFLAMGALALALAGCTESKRASQAATFGDQAADVTCWTYGTEVFSGRSTGMVEYEETGRVSFVDAANGRLTSIEGDCRVVYINGEADAQAEASPPPPPQPPPPPPPPGGVPGKPTPTS